MQCVYRHDHQFIAISFVCVCVCVCVCVGGDRRGGGYLEEWRGGGGVVT